MTGLDRLMGARRRWRVLAGFLFLCLGAGWLAGLATASSVATWYPGLVKPWWTPPAYVFAPVWAALYLMMAVAAFRVWLSDVRFAGTRLALVYFFLQLLLNLAWPFLFFGLRSPGLGLAGIAALWAMVALATHAFFARDRLGGALMLPYLAWVSFASALNAAIWWMN
jgi:tryptophan-rich sensory protein